MTKLNATNDIVQAMLRIGFTQYEAQAYCALLRKSPLNGHEVGKASDVPPSKIYETLGRLETKGAVLVQRSEPVLYAAVPYREVLDAIRARFEGDLGQVDAALAAMPAQSEPGLVWSLKRKTAIVSAFQTAIRSAKESIFAAVWDEEIEEFRETLEQASARGVDVHVAIYGASKLKGPQIYDLAECGVSARSRLAGRRLSVVASDYSNAVMVEFGASDTDEAVVTSNAVLGLLAIEYVKADVLGRLLINAMGADTYAKVSSSKQFKSLLKAG